MVRRILICISLASFIILSAPGAMHAGVVTPQNQSGNQNSDAKSVSGKVTAVGTDHKSFTLEINDNAGQRRWNSSSTTILRCRAASGREPPRQWNTK